MTLVLPGSLRARIEEEARAAFPRECCGLIEGLRAGQDWHVTALHPVRNLAEAKDRFDIDPAAHIAAMKSARGRGRTIIGCYHSHPGGAAAPSRHDVAGAQEQDFLWLIAAYDGMQSRLSAFVYRGPGFEELPLTDAVGADLVTSSLNVRR